MCTQKAVRGFGVSCERLRSLTWRDILLWGWRRCWCIMHSDTRTFNNQPLPRQHLGHEIYSSNIPHSSLHHDTPSLLQLMSILSYSAVTYNGKLDSHGKIFRSYRQGMTGGLSGCYVVTALLAIFEVNSWHMHSHNLESYKPSITQKIYWWLDDIPISQPRGSRLLRRSDMANCGRCSTSTLSSLTPLPLMHRGIASEPRFL